MDKHIHNWAFHTAFSCPVGTSVKDASHTMELFELVRELVNPLAPTE